MTVRPLSAAGTKAPDAPPPARPAAGPDDGRTDERPGTLLGGVMLLLGGMVSIQAGGSIAKLLFPVFGPLGTVGLRLWIAAIVLGLLVRPWRAAPDRATLRLIARYGLAIAAMNVMFYLSLQRLPLGIAVAVEFTGPLALALAGTRRAADLLLVPVILGGLYLLLQPGKVLAGGGLDPVGVGFALLAAAGWAAYILAGAQISRRIDATRGTAIGLAIGALLATPLMLATLPAIVVHPRAGLLAGGVALLSSALPYTMEMLAMKRLHARRFSILSSLEPVVAALAGLLLLGERLAPSQWAGIVCIVIASIAGIVIQRTAGLAAPPVLPEA